MEGRAFDQGGMSSTALATSGITPILLNKSREFEEEEVWKFLCGRVDSEWKRRIGEEGKNKANIYESVLAWANALLKELIASKNQVEVSELLTRVFRYAELVSENQTAYASRNEKERDQKYWPTLTSGKIYQDNFCLKKDRFITRQTKIASAGSCFAVNIGKKLREWGYNYFITEPAPPGLSEEEFRYGAYDRFNARYGTIFNIPSMRQLVERGARLWEPKPLIYQYRGNASDMSDDGMWFDPYREGVHFKSPEDWEATYPRFQEGIERMIHEADVFVFTLGLTEVWYFLNDGSYLSRVPWNLVTGLLGKQILTIEENLAELERLYEIWTSINPNMRFIVSVSPVPLTATFQKDKHVVVATHQAKCTLRCVAEQFAARHDNVDYFPSFEAVMYGSPTPFEEDGRHISKDSVSRAMNMFRETYCVD